MRSILFLILIGFSGLSRAQTPSLQKSALPYLETLHKPSSVEVFKTPFHFPPLNQDTTNACWSFATLSFLETEMARTGLKPVKLSMMYAVYFSFVEKARRYVQTKGESRFAAGDLFSGVLETIQQYGMVPFAVYSGNARSCKTFNHRGLEDELGRFMKKIKTVQLWDEALVVAKVKTILNKHLGSPPESFEYLGKRFTPKSFVKKIVRLPWDDYLMVTSFEYAPFYKFIELNVPDNWAHRKTFINVPLNVFYAGLKQAVQKGYSVAFDSDTGEPGRVGSEDAVFVPEYDIPGRYINQPARELRFKNGSTTDDHLMHILAFKQIEGDDWFLVKDSWRTAWDGNAKGYYYFHGDYLKLKALAYLVHTDAVPEIAGRIKALRSKR